MNKSDHGTVRLARDGKDYVGEYRVQSGMIIVTLRGGATKTTRVGGSEEAPEGLARTMLAELIDEQRMR